MGLSHQDFTDDSMQKIIQEESFTDGKPDVLKQLKFQSYFANELTLNNSNQFMWSNVQQPQFMLIDEWVAVPNSHIIKSQSNVFATSVPPEVTQSSSGINNEFKLINTSLWNNDNSYIPEPTNFPVLHLNQQSSYTVTHSCLIIRPEEGLFPLGSPENVPHQQNLRQIS